MRHFVRVAVAAALIGAPAAAQELVYTPINPSFGGSSFNSGHLLAIAEINRPDPPEDDDFFGQNELTQAEEFQQQLEARIVTRLSEDIADAIFGEEGPENGEFELDQTRINFNRRPDGSVQVQITDFVSGGTTSITVPGSIGN